MNIEYIEYDPVKNWVFNNRIYEFDLEPKHEHQTMRHEKAEFDIEAIRKLRKRVVRQATPRSLEGLDIGF
jgi:hypothetical protein